MKVVLDTNVLVSSLIVPGSAPHRIYEAWRAGAFVIFTCNAQFEEFRRVTRHEKVRCYVDASTAGTLLNELRKVAPHIEKLPKVKRSSDAADDYLLALAEAASADYLVTGDKSGLLALKRHKSTRIVTVRQFSELLRQRRRTR